MKLKIILISIIILNNLTLKVKSQILVENINNHKQIEIDTNDRIKIVYETEKKFNGFYDFLIFPHKDLTKEKWRIIIK